MDWENLLGYVTGLRLFMGDLSFSTLVGTTIFVHLLDAVICRLFAHNNEYPKGLWTLLGFVFGIWAIFALLFVPKRQRT
ncbi:MAG: hypothetical protein AB7G75_24605 [Candidatus Binatia bacterium]